MHLTSGRRRTYLRAIILIVFVVAALPLTLMGEEQIGSKDFSGMQWRLIGPFPGGRVTAVAAVPGDPNTYYFGTPGGGIWKTMDGGQVWRPIFDQATYPAIGPNSASAWASLQPGLIEPIAVPLTRFIREGTESGLWGDEITPNMMAPGCFWLCDGAG